MIGLDCETGNFEDCLVDSELISRNDCKGVLVFADVTSSCVGGIHWELLNSRIITRL